MAITSLAARSEQKKVTNVPGPGAYGGHTVYNAVQSCAPFASSASRMRDHDFQDGPPPGAYDPKFPTGRESSDAHYRRHVPFGTSADRSKGQKPMGEGAAPGTYTLTYFARDEEARQGRDRKTDRHARGALQKHTQRRPVTAGSDLSKLGLVLTL